MSDTNPPPANTVDAGSADPSQPQSPSANIVSKVVDKIKSEPLLFMIAVIVLISGLAVQATNLGSSNFRFILVVIAILATVAVLGYYTVQVLQVRPQAPAVSRTGAQITNATTAGIFDAGHAVIHGGVQAGVVIGNIGPSPESKPVTNEPGPPKDPPPASKK